MEYLDAASRACAHCFCLRGRPRSPWGNDWIYRELANERRSNLYTTTRVLLNGSVDRQVRRCAGRLVPHSLHKPEFSAFVITFAIPRANCLGAERVED